MYACIFICIIYSILFIYLYMHVCMPHLPQGWREKAMAFLLFQIAYFVPVFLFLTLFQFTDKIHTSAL